MRELKFRAWDDVDKRMSYSSTEQFDDMLGFRFDHFETDKPVYMQYTGLKDKNSKEIYEGDIVKGYWWDKGTQHRHIGTVSYVMNAFVVRGVKQYKGLDKELNPIYEVIGNICENSELLKGDEDDA